MAGQAVIILIPYLNRVIKHISGQTGVSLRFRGNTRGFSVANYNHLRNDNGDGCLAPEARRHTIGCCHVVQRIGNCEFRMQEKFFIFYDPRTLQVAPCNF